MSLPQQDLIHLWDHFPLFWSTSSIPYLGIRLTSNPVSLYQANYLPMLPHLSSLLDTWRPLCVSWLGRVAAVKMSLLPKLLYLYRVLPIAIPSYFHRIIQSCVFKYIWGPIKPRVTRSILLRSKLCGGLGLPNFAHYYHAAQVAQLTLLHAKTEIPLWVSLEAIELSPLMVSNMQWLHSSTRGLISNPVTRHSLKLWDRLRGPFQLISPHSLLLSFLGHPLFYLVFTEPHSFQNWLQAELSRICDLVSDTTLKMFPALQSQAGLPPNECFRYLQVAHFSQTVGQIALSKMYSLLHILYTFRTIPLPFLQGQLKKLQTIITSYIWNGKRSWLRCNTLCTPISSGGMGALNIQAYYKATILDQAKSWSALTQLHLAPN